MLGVLLLCAGASKLGAFDLGGAWGRSSGTPNEMISTILETSFEIFSGNIGGKSFPTSRRLHRYMARANSGKRSWPDFVVSDRTLHEYLSYLSSQSIRATYHICARSFPGSLERTSSSLTFSPVLSQRLKLLLPTFRPTIQRLFFAHRRLEQLFKFGLISSRQEGKADLRDLGRAVRMLVS